MQSPHSACVNEKRNTRCVTGQGSILSSNSMFSSSSPQTPSSSVHKSSPNQTNYACWNGTNKSKTSDKRCQCIPPVSALGTQLQLLRSPSNHESGPPARFFFQGKFGFKGEISQILSVKAQVVAAIEKEQIFLNLHLSFCQALRRNPMSDANMLKMDLRIVKNS